MAEQVIRLLWVVVLASKARVAGFVVVNLERVPRFDNDPNTNIKLSMQYQQWIFYVLLSDPSFLRRLVCLWSKWIQRLYAIGGLHQRKLCVVAYPRVAVEDPYLSPATQTPWLHYPLVVSPV